MINRQLKPSLSTSELDSKSVESEFTGHYSLLSPREMTVEPLLCCIRDTYWKILMNSRYPILINYNVNFQSFIQRRRNQDNLRDLFSLSAVLRERSRMADLIKAQSPATAVFPDLGFSGDEVPEEENHDLIFLLTGCFYEKAFM